MDEDETTPDATPADEAPMTLETRVARLEEQIAALANVAAEHDEAIEDIENGGSDGSTDDGTDLGPPTPDTAPDAPEGTPTTEPDAKPRNIHWLFGKLW